MCHYRYVLVIMDCGGVVSSSSDVCLFVLWLLLSCFYVVCLVLSDG